MAHHYFTTRTGAMIIALFFWSNEGGGEIDTLLCMCSGYGANIRYHIAKMRKYSKKDNVIESLTL